MVPSGGHGAQALAMCTYIVLEYRKSIMIGGRYEDGH
jgi:hypothetical protein